MADSLPPRLSLGSSSPGDDQADPSILAVFQDYVKLMPLVVEANQMSEELKKVTFYTLTMA